MIKINTINIEKILELQYNKEEFILVEVLPENPYNEEHLPGAINIPAEKLSDLAPEKLKKDETIIVYCSQYACNASPAAAKKLTSMGYKHVYDFSAGKKGWKEAGLPME
ncbi:MAG: rhodanese-like domain-containing protein [Candidatus Marinimicrobia bacterium]|nr:rhodanese-like domain-containing protein [Candidatus Neomarinimicrobiota bacterium]